ncbi:MAG: response regulator transcription factor [Deltaproteobacteria bacterium]|nr:response regulator transcription factor [Deltaproteobacteria bacterium]
MSRHSPSGGSSGPRILVIEDEPTITEFLKTGLAYEGYEVIVALDGKTGLDLFREKEFDLIILDIMLPDIDGFEVCRRIRETGIETPILMLTAKKEISDRVTGLDIGADDYMTKPFSFDELLARMRALFRRAGRKLESAELHATDIVLNTDTREVFVRGKRVYLTPTEFSLLELFMRHPRRVFTRNTLLNRVWGYHYIGGTNIVDVHVSHLRDKIGDRPSRLIRTHYGVGYAFYPEA